MKAKPIIALIGRKINYNKKEFLGVYNNYLNKIIINGGIPIIVTLDSDFYKIIDMCDGVILPGGDDILDKEVDLIKYLIKNDIPTLGICLGAQIMASFLGCNIIEVNNHMNNFHDIKIIKNTLLHSIYNTDLITVNSRHSFKIEKNPKIEASALSFDGVIEAIELKEKKFFLGVQWHPEDLESNLIFKKFISSISR